MSIKKKSWIGILTTSLLFLGAMEYNPNQKSGVASVEPVNAQSLESGTIVEIATFKLKEGVTPDEFYPVDQAVESQHVSQQPGFISRESAVSEDNEWLAIVHWRSMEDAQASMASFSSAPATAEFMSKLEADTMSMTRYDSYALHEILQSESEESLQMESPTMIEKVRALLNSFNTGDQAPIAYINPDKYIQHNLAVADGLAGFGEVMHNAPPQGFSANVVRAFQDGDYVITHTEYDFFGPKIGFDVFRFEDGLIVEHWDNLQTTVTDTVSGRSMIDGPTEVVDLDKTEANKALVQSLLDEVFFGGNVDKLPSYFSPSEYAQHNPSVGDGLDAFMTASAAMAQAGTPMTYTKNHAIFGQGNFVLAISEGEFMGNPTIFYDLFRVQDGLIVEHWDTLETMPPRDQWKNDNGKFGFGSDVTSAGNS